MKRVYPGCFLVVERKGTDWIFKAGKVFYNSGDSCWGSTPLEFLKKRLARYQIKASQVITELFRINAGRSGFYLADLQARRYYYCGLDWEDVSRQLRQLGIGCDDPMDQASD